MTHAQLVDKSVGHEGPTREQIERLEAVMNMAPQIDLQTRHYFAHGLYAREIFIPAGTVLTGAVHKSEHINVCCGDITVWTEDGMRRLTGWHTMVSRAGAKRVGYAHSDTVWVTLHHTDKSELSDIESDLVEEPDALQTRRGGLTYADLSALEA